MCLRIVYIVCVCVSAACMRVWFIVFCAYHYVYVCVRASMVYSGYHYVYVCVCVCACEYGL